VIEKVYYLLTIEVGIPTSEVEEGASLIARVEFITK